MGGEYYYLMASMPHLEFGKEPPLGTDAFIEECSKWMKETDLAKIRTVTGSSGTARKNSGILKSWLEFDTEIKQDIAEYRELGLKGEAKAEGMVKRITQQKDPLKAEVFFERIRWDLIEDLEVGHYFDLEGVLAYCIKLVILERLTKFDKEKGKKIFNEICEVGYDEQER